MPPHTRLDAVLAARFARPAYHSRASLPTGMQPEPMTDESAPPRTMTESETKKFFNESIMEMFHAQGEVKTAQSKRDALQGQLNYATMDLVRKNAALEAKKKKLSSWLGVPAETIIERLSEFTEVENLRLLSNAASMSRSG